MADNVTEMMHRERNLGNNDGNDNSSKNHSWLPRFFSRKNSDNNSNNNHLQSSHQQSASNYNELSSLAAVRVPRPLSSNRSLDTSYDTDGGMGPSGNMPKHHHHSSSSNYEHLISPRLPVRRTMGIPSRQLAVVPLQHRLSHKTHLASTPSLAQNHDSRDDELNYDSDNRRVHANPNRRAHLPPIPNGNHGARANFSPAFLQHVGPLVATPAVKPLRIIFMRHSERANQALGPDWFIKAFRSNTYKAYDSNLPIILPRRRYDQAYEFDVPLTVRGLKAARLTGRAMMSNSLAVDICLSSTALRCIQTCERILTGMDRRDRVPIRIEPGLFECPHLNYKIVDSFMTKKELADNRYNIKHEYKPLVPQLIVPETLEQYFERSAVVMRGIIDRYGQHGGTVLIVTHAPGLLALTEALKGYRPHSETFYRTVSAYSPLAMYIADYDGSKWRNSEQPFNLDSNGQL